MVSTLSDWKRAWLESHLSTLLQTHENICINTSHLTQTTESFNSHSYCYLMYRWYTVAAPGKLFLGGLEKFFGGLKEFNSCGDRRNYEAFAKLWPNKRKKRKTYIVLVWHASLLSHTYILSCGITWFAWLLKCQVPQSYVFFWLDDIKNTFYLNVYSV